MTNRERAEISVGKNEKAIIDSDMLQIVSSHTWRPHYQHGVCYARSQWWDKEKKEARHLHLHHLIIGQPLKGKQIDHINGNPLDNRMENLRVVSARQNSWNRREIREKETTSRYVGVHRHKDGRWVAQITIEGKRKHLGSFKTEQAASVAYLRALPISGKEGE